MYSKSFYEAQFAAHYVARISEQSASVWQKLATLKIMGGLGALAAYLVNNAELSDGIGLLLWIQKTISWIG